MTEIIQSIQRKSLGKSSCEILLMACLTGVIMLPVSAQPQTINGFVPDGLLHKGPPPQLIPGKLRATYTRSQPNVKHAGSVETILTLSNDGTAAMYNFRMLNNRTVGGATLYWYWRMEKSKNPAEGSALILTDHKHTTFIGARLLDKGQEWGTISPDGKTLKLFEMNTMNVYTRK